MNPTTRPMDPWAAIDRERRRDRLVKALSVVAWTITFLAVLAFAGVIAARVAYMRKLVAVGVQMPNVLYEVLVPLIAVVGVLALLIATLSTVGIFLRQRTASLTEIQVRLAALEQIVRGEGREDANRQSAAALPHRQ